MKALMGFLAGAGILGFFALIALWVTLVFGTIYGVYLAFSASIILGIIVLFVEPAPLIIGLVMMFMHVNLATEIMSWIAQHVK